MTELMKQASKEQLQDSFGRPITYVRVSVTDRCNLRCQYCMPEEGVPRKTHHDILRFEEMMPILSALSEMGIEKVRITGGEPLIRRGILDFAAQISSLPGIRTRSLTTNGTFLKDYAKPLKEAGITGLNISLDTLDPDKYHSLTRVGELKDVLEGLELALALGFESIKINAVLAKGFNDDEIPNLAALTKKYPIDVRFIELMPIGGCAGWAERHFMPSSEVEQLLPEIEPLKDEEIDPSSPARYFKLPDGLGRIGLIDPVSCSFCAYCNRVRLTADGKLKSCLHSDDETDLTPFLHDREALNQAIRDGVSRKQKEHHLYQQDSIHRDMVQIGG